MISSLFLLKVGPRRYETVSKKVLKMPVGAGVEVPLMNNWEVLLSP